MTAERIDTGPPTPWQPDPVRQRLAGYTVDDVLALPDDAPRVELVDGVMLVVPSPIEDHQDISFLICAWLRAHAPRRFKAAQALGVAVNDRTTYEPDVLLRHSGGGGGRHFFAPDQLVLVVEVVSTGTRRRDRITKPAAYADAGIPYYWRVEQKPVHVYAYRLEGNVYKPQRDSADVLVVDEPFPIRLPLAEITP